MTTIPTRTPTPAAAAAAGPPNRPAVSDRLRRGRVIAVLRGPDVASLRPVCQVLVEEGIPSLELTLTTPGLLPVVEGFVADLGGSADVGVGTVRTLDDARRCIDQGADYLVTPTMNLDVVDLAVTNQVAVFPGGFSPTELAAGWEAGASAVKIFPAETVGAGYLKHLRGPFPDLVAVPSGGIDLAATREWLSAGALAVSLGGPLLGDALKGGDLQALRDRCRAVLALVDEAGAA